jgi:endonuclease III
VNKNNILSVCKSLDRFHRNQKTELSYQSNYELLISVILSAQATDISVNRATEKLYKVANTPETMVHLGLAKLKSHIKTIGLYNTKAKHVIACSKLLIDKHNSSVPSSREELEALPGVGRKTANVVLNIVFGHPTIAVDTHVFRVSNRIGFSSGKTPLQVEMDLLKVIPETYLGIMHHLLIYHGRYVCIARKPLCETCVIRNHCRYFNNK